MTLRESNTELLLLLVLLLLLLYLLSPICRVYTITYLKQTMFLGYMIIIILTSLLNSSFFFLVPVVVAVVLLDGQWRSDAMQAINLGS